MTFERTANYPLLGELLRNPSLYPFLCDDYSPPIDEAAVAENDGIWYVLARDERGELLGFWLLAPHSAICWEIHTVMALDRRALAALRELIGPGGWLWKNTPCLRLVTNVPAWNGIALRFGLRGGLSEYGRNPESFMKGGRLFDQILLGISKPKD